MGIPSRVTKSGNSITGGFELIRIPGGLAPDTDEPMPEAMRNKLQELWRTIQLTVPDTEFDFRYWEVSTPRCSTYRACLAVIAAAQQGDYGPAMIEAIRRTDYLEAPNHSDLRTLIDLAQDMNQFGRESPPLQVGVEKRRFRHSQTTQ